MNVVNYAGFFQGYGLRQHPPSRTAQNQRVSQVAKKHIGRPQPSQHQRRRVHHGAQNGLEKRKELTNRIFGCIEKGQFAASIQILKNHPGINVNEVDQSGYTFLQRLSERRIAGDELRQLINLLINRGADVNKPTPDTDLAPFDLAIRSAHWEVLDILYEKGAKPRKIRDQFNGERTYTYIYTALKSCEFMTPLSYMQHQKELASGLMKHYDAALNLVKELDGGFLDTLRNFKFLGHRFGLSKISEVEFEGHTIQLEGMWKKANIHLTPSFKSVFQKSPLYNDLLRGHEQISKSHQEQFSHYKAGGITCLYTEINTAEGRFSQHAVYTVLWKDYLIKCNRGYGAGDEPGLVIYKIKGNVTLDTILKLQGEDENYFLKGIDTELKLSKESVVSQKNHKSGTCGWASAKASLLATLLLTHMKQGMTRQDALDAAKREYKQWSFEDRDLFLNEVLKSKPNEALINVLTHVLYKVASKAQIEKLMTKDMSVTRRELLQNTLNEIIDQSPHREPKCRQETVLQLISYIERS